MNRLERLTRFVIITIGFVVVSLPLATSVQTPLIHASVAESGGWSPDVFHAIVGEPLYLRFISDDVMHGFAVGQMEMQPVILEPGKVSETTLTFNKPGRYTFYCTRWCGVNHWRMRGTIEVTGVSSDPQPVTQPLYLSLSLDIDSPHPSASVPLRNPSVMRGEELLPRLTDLSIYLSTDYYRSHSPVQAFQDLSTKGFTVSQRWDIVAAIWLRNATPVGLAEGERLYTQNCAACHGETGAGNGVFADDLRAAGNASMQKMHGDVAMQSPADFTRHDLLGASPALLMGKILRGGMGTGMPMWGNILTEEQLWNLVEYLYNFQFEQ